MKTSNYSILINTTDSFEDCWEPFFTLFKKYWPNYTGKIYLNTESKIYKYPGLNIISIQNNINTPKENPSWSECLRRALNSIDSDVVLYLQEDYFFKNNIEHLIISDYAEMMYNNNDLHCIHLTDQGAPSKEKSIYKGLWTVPKYHQDRISCQAALWKKSVLTQYIRTYESGWNFEWWGSKRAAVLKHNFFVVDRNWCKKDFFEIIPYVFTGVIGGRWFKEVVPLFLKHNIVVDFSKRGFFEPTEINFKKQITRKVKRLPVEIRSLFGLLILKIKVNYGV